MSMASRRAVGRERVSASISAFDHPLLSAGRSVARRMSPPSPAAAAVKNSPRVTPKAAAIFSMELIDGET
jgi:hypothetical protein